MPRRCSGGAIRSIRNRRIYAPGPKTWPEALKADQDISKTVCGTRDGPHCPDFATCPYQAMKQKAAQAKVVVGSSNWLFHALPKKVAKDIRRLVIEEDFTQ